MGKPKVDHVRGLLAEPAVAAAWLARHGRAPGAAEVEALMTRLGPLMRDHAARASLLVRVRRNFRSVEVSGPARGIFNRLYPGHDQPVLARAADQGYLPEHLVCSGETPAGRPSPLMIYKACAELGVWPLSRVVKVDDAEVGIAEGKAAGAFTVGVTSGNSVGLPLQAFQALPAAERERRAALASRALYGAGADLVIDSVATLVPALERTIQAS